MQKRTALAVLAMCPRCSLVLPAAAGQRIVVMLSVIDNIGNNNSNHHNHNHNKNKRERLDFQLRMVGEDIMCRT
uniref:Putative secreted protein n=1 Tax=Panstrongylus lignarius TaxID=156445 RepID=A0A224Y5I8_9HEMI